MRTTRLLSSFAVYGVAIILMKGFSLISIPLVAWKLQPAEFGELDLAASLIEFAALFSALGLTELLYRFCAGDSDDDRANLAALAGTAAIAITVLIVLMQAVAGPLHGWAGLGVSESAFRLALAAASMTALIEAPLAWLRLRDRPLAFLGFILARAVTQIALVWIVLDAGFGASGVLVANASVDMILAATLAAAFLRKNGIRLDAAMTRRLGAYGLPIVLSGLAMFALGAADRWFLAGHVARADMAQYAIAAKLALATALVIQPFGLWWYPRRLALLATAGGREQNATAWLGGLAILVAGSVGIHLAMPVFVTLALPSAYAQALHWLPWLIAAIALNELVSLSNAGAYLGSNTVRVLATNGVAALIAVSLYALLIPAHGLHGAIWATLAAQGFRLAAFVWQSRHLAPVPLLTPGAALIVLAGLSPALILPTDAGMPLTAGAAVLSPVLALAAFLAARPALLPGMRRHAIRA